MTGTTYEGRKAAIEKWLRDDEDDLALIAGRFHKYDDHFWSDLSEMWDATVEEDGPLHTLVKDRDASLVRMRDGDGDTYGVMVTMFLDDKKCASKTFDCDDLHRDSDTSGFRVAAGALATLDAEIRTMLEDWQMSKLLNDAPKKARLLLDQARGELESGVLGGDGEEMRYLDGVIDALTWAINPGAEVSDQFAALIGRMKRALAGTE